MRVCVRDAAARRGCQARSRTRRGLGAGDRQRSAVPVVSAIPATDQRPRLLWPLLSARALGGDYFDFLAFGSERFGLAIGGVSGKGIAAALLMANLQANLRSQSAK